MVSHDKAELKRIISNFGRLKILVIGDLILDEFIWGKVSRISPEAPVPVAEVTSKTYAPGGAGNNAPASATNNVRGVSP